ncbi:MAG TPA: hypothetical protein VFZ69_04690 [Longimicrobiales bacterium]
MAEGRVETGADYLRRARVRAAVHRFADALDDLATAERLGADRAETSHIRASVFVATGRACEVIQRLQTRAAEQPGYASRLALAGAYAAVGRLADADREYVAAMNHLDTTSPFPYAWIYFARGILWAERGDEPQRGALLYAQALNYLPEFILANVHLAEIEAARGDLASAIARLETVANSSEEPEALALLGELLVRNGDATRGRREISRARQRYEQLLIANRPAFADHAAEFYLGPGANAEHAWALAQENLAARNTERAVSLAVRAASATGRQREASALGDQMGIAFSCSADETGT